MKIDYFTRLIRRLRFLKLFSMKRKLSTKKQMLLKLGRFLKFLGRTRTNFTRRLTNKCLMIIIF